MKILVFISKTTGIRCLDVLFSKYPDDNYLFVVSDPDKELLIEKIKSENKKYLELNDETIRFLESLQADYFDWILNLWGEYIFKENILSKAKKSLNIHPSLLPYGRGRDPVVWAVRYSHPAGVTLHEVSSGVDEGPIYYQEEIPYSFPISGGQLYEKVEKRCWQIFNEKWPSLRDSNSKTKLQQELKDQRTFKRKDLLEDNLLDLEKDITFRENLLRVLAHDFQENLSLELKYKGKEFLVKLDIKEK